MTEQQASAEKQKIVDDSTSSLTSKKRLSQSEVPSYSLEQALRVPRAIAENYAFKPTKPLDVAAALTMTPTSGQFRGLTGAAVAYGLTTGAYNVAEIAITPLAMRIVRPLEEGDDLLAMREAMLKPRVYSEFLKKYNGAQLPKDEIARNVFISMGVPLDKTTESLQLLLQGAEAVGFVKKIKDKRFIDLQGTPEVGSPEAYIEAHEEDEDSSALHDFTGGKKEDGKVQGNMLSLTTPPTSNRVFITHGKNLEIVNQLKELLTFGNFVPVVAAEHETVSKPVPDKVMDDMRSCYAAIIHVGQEVKLLDNEGNEHIFLNQNVLIEIGAAMALYSRRFILLVERGANLPSNLQGLYQVRYEGNKLDYEATMKLLKAFNEFKS